MISSAKMARPGIFQFHPVNGLTWIGLSNCARTMNPRARPPAKPATLPSPAPGCRSCADPDDRTSPLLTPDREAQLHRTPATAQQLMPSSTALLSTARILPIPFAPATMQALRVMINTSGIRLFCFCRSLISVSPFGAYLPAHPHPHITSSSPGRYLLASARNGETHNNCRAFPPRVRYLPGAVDKIDHTPEDGKVFPHPSVGAFTSLSPGQGYAARSPLDAKGCRPASPSIPGSSGILSSL